MRAKDGVVSKVRRDFAPRATSLASKSNSFAFAQLIFITFRSCCLLDGIPINESARLFVRELVTYGKLFFAQHQLPPAADSLGGGVEWRNRRVALHVIIIFAPYPIMQNVIIIIMIRMIRFSCQQTD
jgi:hypothetical protein